MTASRRENPLDKAEKPIDKPDRAQKRDMLKQNLLSLQNGRKMKMKGYQDQWYQFHLEKMPDQRPVRYRG